MSLMEQFANPEMVHQLSFADKLAGAGITTLMGMGTTFTILILLWGIIALTTKIMHKGTEKRTAPAAAAASAGPSVGTPSPAPAATATVAPAAGEEKTSHDGALAAVIAAAIAAYEGGNGEPDLIVKRIRRVSGPSTVWANAGRSETIDSRKI